jgi:hypothetical protein
MKYGGNKSIKENSLRFGKKKIAKKLTVFNVTSVYCPQGFKPTAAGCSLL